MSRIDIVGDRLCLVTCLMILGWFIYSIAF
jgi:hypothetical protein